MYNYLKVYSKQTNNFIQNGSHYFSLLPEISNKHPLQRHTAVLVEFCVMLTVESVLNRSHCGAFLYRSWL